MAKKNDITVSEMRALLPWFLAVNAVYFALLLVLFFACGLNYTLLLGGVWGNLVCAGWGSPRKSRCAGAAGSPPRAT